MSSKFCNANFSFSSFSAFLHLLTLMNDEDNDDRGGLRDKLDLGGVKTTGQLMDIGLYANMWYNLDVRCDFS